MCDLNTGPLLLDLRLTHPEDDITNVDYMPPLGNGDHAALVFHLIVINNDVLA